ncbi:hypothetical protein [Falsirhodobacter sp. 20TX0035]|uniref:hypothetical protein n=1 Tax=Falsirhodobacter sp. 20TX0035 TaxID=3022019 RepID=UPI00232F37E6|nr:hypothetical protein [Falsirhodobacter sp. 20TX0035]
MRDYISRHISAVYVTDAKGNPAPSALVDEAGVSLLVSGLLPPRATGAAIADWTGAVGGKRATFDLAACFTGATSYSVSPKNLPGVTLAGSVLTIAPTAVIAPTVVTVGAHNTHPTPALMTFTLSVNAVAPTVIGPLPDQILAVGDADILLALDTHFADAASYAVSPEGQGVTISGHTLTISAAAERNAIYKVMATNGTGQSVSDSFTLAVAATPSPGWTPAAISGASWLDMTDARTMTVADNRVARVAPRSGGVSLVQTTAAHQPYADGAVGGVTSVRFSGARTFFNFSKPLPAAATVCFVMQSLGSCTLQSALGGDPTVDASRAPMVPLGQQGAVSPEVVRSAGVVTWRRNGELQAPKTRGSAYDLLSPDMAPSLHEFQMTAASGIVAFGAAPFKYYLGASVAEVIIVPGVLSDNDRTNLNAYVRAKYGIGEVPVTSTTTATPTDSGAVIHIV